MGERPRAARWASPEATVAGPVPSGALDSLVPRTGAGAVLVQSAGQMQTLEGELERGCGHTGALLLDAESLEKLGESGEIAELREDVRPSREVGGLRREAAGESRQDRLEVVAGETTPEDLELGGPQGAREDLLLATLLDRVELDPS